jgi:energy-converting hydrogenase Eha subunit A
MPKNTFISLIVAYACGVAGGLLTLLVVSILMSGSYMRHTQDDLFVDTQGVVAIVGVVMSLIATGVFCVAFLLPLAAIEKDKIESKSFKELMIRYAPLICLPVGFIMLLNLLGNNDNADDRAGLCTVILTFFSVCCTSLWMFIKRLKS